ncbi:MAG: hypothetical protein DSM107014_01370 [Gomphosphaeria aponina SAG 52.96 = DSM 107014]|uniref:Uncharacterized protein n=1 Tax=Gomphosphaeria aponina SAG 52.96 = DSM 107014 TaxID=1521640 RepID=A0A941GN77_9CHRO|nr:hypothetical protein [Gomphosphaeria aponina SAG 52.96 = DSM 107014]
MKKIYSFDIFETCIIRTVAQPTDLFYLLFSQILKTQKITSTPELLDELVKQRINCEIQARQHYNNQEDITIKEIYEFFHHPTLTLDKEQLINAELEVEYQCLRPILAIKSQIEQLRKEGKRVIFISDMYLPPSFMKKCLLAHEIAQGDDSIYVSGAIGLTKATGNLFQYILEKEKIKPQQLHHTGDNIYSDVLIPQKLGIKTIYFKDSQLNRYERETITQSLAPVEVRSLIAGISRAVRLNCADNLNISPELAQLAANVIAPLLTSYVFWVIQDANQKGINRLYFVSRDGQILLKIAQELGKYIATPECRYLYGSRQAWFLPSLTEVKREKLDWLILQGHSTSLKSLCKKLGITPEEIKTVLPKYNLSLDLIDKQLNPQEIEKFWQMLANPEVSNLILEKIAINRQVTLKYFEQEGLLKDNKWAIVDVGWTLKTQRSLKIILSQGNFVDEVKGYYLGIFRDRILAQDVGTYNAYLVQEALSFTHLSEKFFKEQAIIEELFTRANHGSVIQYHKQDNQIVPVLKLINNHQEKISNELQKIIRKYTQEIAQTDILKTQLQELKIISLTNTIKFLTNPTAKEAKMVGLFQHGDDQNESRLCPLARKVAFKDLIYFAARLLKIRERRDYQLAVLWREGSIALSHPLIQLMFKIIISVQEYAKSNKPLWLYKLWLNIKKQYKD